MLTSVAPLFAELLYYNGNTSNKQYNGNISYQLWGTASGLTNNYTYGYDQLNRLISGNATTGNNENGITYDPMGNIATLKRYAANAQIDNLTYAYTAGTNTLQSVTDANPSNTGQKSGAATYTYDGNGNLTADNSKGITAISYNLLNLPQTITGKNTTYTYDAGGQKLSRLIGTAKTDYISGIQYDGTAASSTITFIQTEEGRALPNGVVAYNYEYSLTDHLGNSRVNFDTGTGTGVARQVQVDDYYPFGMEINTNVASPKNEYLYNKKELQENLGLYDYGARFYDPVIGRWTSVDPLVEAGQESTSPYGYVFGNPIKLTDPDGRYPDGDDPDDGLNAVRMGLALGGALKSVEMSFKTLLYNAGDAIGVTPAKPGMKWEATQKYNEATGKFDDVMEQVPRGTLLQDLGSHAIDGLNVGAGLLSLNKGTTGSSFFAKSQTEPETASVIKQASNKALTEPTLPPKTIAEQDGVKVVHYTRSGDHGPPHLHVDGGGKSTKIGQAGKPIKGSPPLSSTQQSVVDEFKSEIRSAVRKIGRWFDYQSKQ